MNVFIALKGTQFLNFICDITKICPHWIYYYKERGYDSQQVPAVQGF